MKASKRYFALLLGLLLVLMSLPVQVFAAGSIDPREEAALTLIYCDDDKPLTGAEFELYRIASVKTSGELVVEEDFSDYVKKLPSHDAEQWRALASTLEGYVLRDRFEPYAAGETGKGGTLTFPGDKEELEHGLYLVLGRRHYQSGNYYDAQPFLVMLPSISTEENVWNYSVESRVKFEKIPDASADEQDRTVSRKALKVWKDEGHENSRPDSVTVQLLCDGRIHDTAVLSSINNWRHTWSDLDAGHVWNIVEKNIGEGYYVTIERSGSTFVITNAFEEELIEDDPPRNDPPEDEEIPGDDTPSAPPPAGPQLPQTGQLWWPVPVLFAAGLLLIVLGLIRHRGDYEA